MLTVTTAWANPKYRVSSAHQMSWITSGTKYVTVQRLTSDSETVSLYLYGAKYSIGATSLHWNNGDTSTRSVSLSFSSTANDTSHGNVILRDGITTDTVSLTGYDTAYTHPTYDFTLSTHWTSFISTSDSGTTSVIVRNVQGIPIRVLAMSSKSSYWTINHNGFDSASFTVAGGSSVFSRITYHRHGVSYDTTYIYFYCASPYAQVDSLRVYVQDSIVPTNPRDFSLSRHTLSLSCNGKPVTGFVTDTNVGSTSIYVTAYGYVYNHWQLNGRNDTLYTSIASTINAHSTASLSITYVPHGVTRDTLLIIYYCYSPYTQWDSLWVYAYDSSASSVAYTISPHQVRFTCRADTETGYTQFHNIRSSSISIMARKVGNSNWSIFGGTDDSIWFTMTGSSYRWFPIKYHSHDVQYDTCKVYFYCGSPFTQWDSITVYVWDSTYVLPSIDLRVPNLQSIYAGDSSCGNVIIKNTGTTTATISSIGLDNYAIWSLTGRPFLPYKLPAGDSILVDLCCKPRSIGEQSVGVTVGYGSPQTTSATAYVTVPNGLSPQDTVNLDDVVVGGYDDITVPIISKALDTVRFDHYYTGHRADTLLSPTFPRVLHPGDTAFVHIRFQPDSLGTYREYYYFQGSTQSNASLMLIGRAVPPTDTFQLFRSQTSGLTLVTDTSVVFHTFYFQNPLSSTIYVTSVDLDDTTHFSITGITPHAPKDTLSSGGVVGVDIQFRGDTSGMYRDTLIITTENSAQSWKFGLQAIYRIKTTSGVGPAPTAGIATLSVNPNPAREVIHVDITNARDALLEMFDLLGNRIGSGAHALSCSWAREDLADGIYIIRATGRDLNEIPFVLSRRVIFEKK